MAKEEYMNYIASLIKECLEEAGLNKAYVSDITVKMKNESKYESLIRVSDLDSANKERQGKFTYMPMFKGFAAC